MRVDGVRGPESGRPAGRAVGIAVAVALTGVALTSQSPSVVEGLLRTPMGFSNGDVRDFRSGSVVVRSLDTQVGEEVAHAGVVHIDAPIGLVVDRFRDIEAFERGSGVPQIGRFSDPPRLADLASLTLPDEDIADLEDCRPGDCKVKLSAEAIGRLQREVDWTSPEAAPQATAAFRRLVLDMVRAYQQRGNAALGTYDNRREPLQVSEHVRAVLEADDQLPVAVPALLRYLSEYPAGRPAGAQDFFYWSVVNFGLRDTVRVNHVTILPLDGHLGARYVIAIKQIYANHYFYTTLELRFLFDDPRRGDQPGTTLISVTRSRNDGMTGFTGLFLGPIIRGRSRDGVQRYLEYMRRQIEAPAAAGGDAAYEPAVPRPPIDV